MTALRLPSRRAAAAIAAVGIVLAAAAGGVDVLQGSRYDASTIVFLAQVFPSQTAANAASIADDLETAVRLPASRQQITRSTRITASALRSGLSLGEIGTSASVRIGYKGTSAAQAAAVATTAARVGLTALADVQVQ